MSRDDSAEARLKRTLARILGDEAIGLIPVSGGCISRASAVRGSRPNPAAFVKWGDETSAHLPGFFAAEADGLSRLRGANAALRVPEVLACQEEEKETGDAPPPFLLLEYIEQAPPTNPAEFAARFGRALAQMHRENSTPEGTFGLERDNYIGVLPQKNRPRAARWADFYRDCRLLPQMAMARERGLLPPSRERLLMSLIGCLQDLLGDMQDSPSLLHGDLWSGNFLCAGGRVPVLIDPSICYGPREMEMAYIELFGGFPPGFLDAYQDAFPLDAGYSFRRPLHQLYPLLFHLNHFSETYGPRVEQVCRHYGM